MTQNTPSPSERSLFRSKVQRNEKLSGFIILRFAFKYAYHEGIDLYGFAKKHNLRKLHDLLSGKYRPRGASKQVDTISLQKLKTLEGAAWESKLPPLIAQRSGLKPRRSLSCYWRLDYRKTNHDLNTITQLFEELEEIDIAYQELEAEDPNPRVEVKPLDDPQYVIQSYCEAAPIGIDAKWVWNQHKIAGQGVGFIDLERAWALPHEDLLAANPTLIVNENFYTINPPKGNHGTSTLGVVAAVDNQKGVIGIASSVEYVKLASHYRSGTHGQVANAIGKVLDEFYDGKVKVGDVLLLEVTKGGYPTEIDDVDFCAIQQACDLGLIVVEAAGNGKHNLNEWRDKTYGYHMLNRNKTYEFEDSGAIVVGAARAERSSKYMEHSRLPFSCYGNRVDCYAWGENVLTTTAGSKKYNMYNGTSAASAIIAGAAILLQSYYKEKQRRVLSSYEMRYLLSDPATGTLQGNSRQGHIGVMPDLKRIIQNPLIF